MVVQRRMFHGNVCVDLSMVCVCVCVGRKKVSSGGMMILWFPLRPHLPSLSRPPLKSPVQHSWSIPPAFITRSRTPPRNPHASPLCAPLPPQLPQKISEARSRMSAVRLSRARARSLPPSLQHRGHCSSSSVHFSSNRSLHPFSPLPLRLQGFAPL